VEHPDRTAEFLGEVAGYPKPGEGTMQLLGARNDPRLMAEWMERTVSEWVGAEARRRPLLLALEDLHWGDLATVNYLARALREHPEQPWMVLALARPEVDEAFPKLWSEVSPQRLDLTPLSRRAGEQLVRAVLGDDVSAEAVARVVERAGGNAFYLEELIRHAAEGGADLPDTVLAMVQSRLEGLEPEARRVLQVASVFGETFREAGVEALLGGESAPMYVGGWLEHLVDVEMLEHGHGSGAAAGELAFRHALVREAAYALIADADKRTAHLAAAEWLEQEPATDPLVLIEHFEKAGAPERAIDHYLRAAEQAYGAGDFQAACSLCEQGRVAGADGEPQGQLGVLQAYACTWLGLWDDAMKSFDRALPLLPTGSATWCQAAGLKLYVAAHSGRPALALETLVQLVQMEDVPDATGRTGQAMACVVLAMGAVEQSELARQQLDRMACGAAKHEVDPAFMGWWRLASLFVSLSVLDDPDAALAHGREGQTDFTEAGDRIAAGALNVMLGLTWFSVGSLHRSFEMLAGLMNPDSPSYIRDAAASVRSHVEIELGRPESAVETARPRMVAASAEIQASCRQALALAEGARGRHEAMLRGVLESLELDSPVHTRVQGLGLAAEAHLALEDPESSLRAAEEGIGLARSAAVYPHVRAALLLTRAEALMALGREDEAREAIRVARDRLLRIHATVPDDLKHGYLSGLRAHRRTIELAHQWLGET
jgi:eukaryotic-like serine/threonine-protein kinase